MSLEFKYGKSLLTSKAFLPDVGSGLVGCVIVILAFLEGLEPTVVSLAIMYEIVYCLVRVRRNRLLLFVYGVIAYSCYSICYANYFHRFTDTMYTAVADLSEAYCALVLLLMFVSCLVLFLPKEVKTYGYGAPNLNAIHCNHVIVIVICILILLICVYGFARPDSVGGDRGSPSPLYEYSVIPFMLALYLAGDSKGLRGLILCVLFIYAMQNFIYGGRIHAIQAIVAVFFFLFNGKTKTSTLVVLTLVFAALMISLGLVRTAVWSGGLPMVLEGLRSRIGTGLAWDTAYSAWYTSITFVRFDGIISQSQHYYYLGQWLLSIPFGGSAVVDSDLQELTRVYYYHNNGGLLPLYVWFHLGLLGVAGFAFLVSFLSSAANRFDPCVFRNSESAVLIAANFCIIYFVITSLRWFLYSPSQITRGIILCFVVCAIVVWIDKNMTENKNIELRRKRT